MATKNQAAVAAPNPAQELTPGQKAAATKKLKAQQAALAAKEADGDEDPDLVVTIDAGVEVAAEPESPGYNAPDPEGTDQVTEEVDEAEPQVSSELVLEDVNTDEPTDEPTVGKPVEPAKKIKFVKVGGSESSDTKPAPPKSKKASVELVTPDEPEFTQNETVSRKQVAEEVRCLMLKQGLGVSEKLSLALVEAFEQVVINTISQGKNVLLPGFGKFKVEPRSTVPTSESVNPVTTWKVSFQVGKALKIQQVTAH